MRAAHLLTLTVLLTGCGVSSSETFTIRPNVTWETVNHTTPVELKQQRDLGSKEVVSKSRVSPQKQLNFSGLAQARETLLTMAAEKGLTERALTKSEQSARWSEALENEKGTRLLLREDPNGRFLEASVVGPLNSTTSALRDQIRTEFAPPPPPPAAGDPAEEFRRQYNLPGRQKAR